MNTTETQVNLAIYLGETYTEIEARSQDGISLFKKNFYLPQTSFKSSLNQTKTLLTDQKIQSVYVVCRYFDKLKNFRLGGSVVQITEKDFDNSYLVENTSKLSLAASSLIFNYDTSWTNEHLTEVLNKIRKTNAEANKIVISLPKEKLDSPHVQQVKDFFIDNQFKIFEVTDHKDLSSLRFCLLEAGTEGTKSEIIEDIQEILQPTHTYFWSKQKFTSQFNNVDLYFSWSDFLGHYLYTNKLKYLVHFDFDSFFVLSAKKLSQWDSPWGTIEREHYKPEAIGLHPLTEIFIDSSSLLEFSKVPSPSEPGPMVAGRGTKTLLLDAFYESIYTDEVTGLFSNLSAANVKSKIAAQFKAMENVQNNERPTIGQKDITTLIQDVIQIDLARIGVIPNESVFSGHLKHLFFKKQKNELKSWTEIIFSNSHNTEVIK